MEKNEDLEESFKDIFRAILEGAKRETKEKYGEIIEELIQKQEESFENPEKFDILIRYEIEKILEACLRETYSNLSEDNFSKIIFIYFQYSFVKNQLTKLFERVEGTSCSVDKSRWLINSYIEFVLTGILPNMEIEEKCFWKPHFGTSEEWIDFIESIIKLYYGDPLKYIGYMIKFK